MLTCYDILIIVISFGNNLGLRSRRIVRDIYVMLITLALLITQFNSIL